MRVRGGDADHRDRRREAFVNIPLEKEPGGLGEIDLQQRVQMNRVQTAIKEGRHKVHRRRRGRHLIQQHQEQLS
jgi:hypothetical protein